MTGFGAVVEADTMNDIFCNSFQNTSPFASRDVRPFSDKADGTLLGEGVAIFALRRLSDAERDGNHIYAVIMALEARATVALNRSMHRYRRAKQPPSPGPMTMLALTPRQSSLLRPTEQEQRQGMLLVRACALLLIATMFGVSRLLLAASKLRSVTASYRWCCRLVQG